MMLVTLFFVSAFVLQHASSSCVTHDDCEHDLNATLYHYDEQHAHLEEVLAMEVYRMERTLQSAALALNERIQRGLPACRKHYLKQATLAVYRLALNSACNLTSIAFSLEDLPGEYTDTEEHQHEKVICDTLVPVLNAYCTRIAHEIDAVMECDVQKEFAEAFEVPWRRCIDVQPFPLPIRGAK